jgi:hypothetical protein
LKTRVVSFSFTPRKDRHSMYIGLGLNQLLIVEGKGLEQMVPILGSRSDSIPGSDLVLPGLDPGFRHIFVEIPQHCQKY